MSPRFQAVHADSLELLLWRIDCSLSRNLESKTPPWVCIHALGIRDDSNPSEIKTIGIPACADRGIIVMDDFRMPGTGRLQQVELRIANLEVDISKLTGIGGTPPSVVGISEFILPPAVVKEGEETHHRHVGTSFPR